MSNDISTEIKALHQHIQQAATQLVDRPAGGDSDDGLGTLIYLGNHHDAVPRDLIIDPVLLPEEIVTWMLMKIHVDNPRLATRIPSRAMLMERLKCSRPIVSRNIQVLRAMRWLTLCAEVRGAGGQFRGVVYVQHDTPLSLSETLYLDPKYIDWLEQPVRGDVLKRLSTIKRSVLIHTDHRVIDRGDSLNKPTTPLTQIAARLKGQQSADPLETHLATPAETVKAVEKDVPGILDQIYGSKAPPNPLPVHHVKNIDMVNDPKSHHVKDLYMVETQQNSHSHHVKDFYMAENHRVKNIDMAPSSSSSFKSFKNKKTTTTPPTPPSLKMPTEVSKSPRQIAYAMKILEPLPEHGEQNRQYALYWLEDRIKDGKDGIVSRVGNPIQFLGWIVRSILDGTLPESSYGLRDDAKTCRSSIPDAVDPDTAKRQFEAHMLSLGAKIDPETGLAVRAKG